jgi:hypothetical protein
MTAFNFRMHAGGACKPLLPLADNIIEQDADVALWHLAASAKCAMSAIGA